MSAPEIWHAHESELEPGVDEQSSSDDDEEPENGVVVNPNGLVQLPYPKKKPGRHAVGAPRNDLMDQPACYVLLF